MSLVRMIADDFVRNADEYFAVLFVVAAWIVFG